jgi:hypothetical protein
LIQICGRKFTQILAAIVDNRDSIDSIERVDKRRLNHQHDTSVHQTSDNCPSEIDYALTDKNFDVGQNLTELQNAKRTVDLEYGRLPRYVHQRSAYDRALTIRAGHEAFARKIAQHVRHQAKDFAGSLHTEITVAGPLRPNSLVIRPPWQQAITSQVICSMEYS